MGFRPGVGGKLLGKGEGRAGHRGGGACRQPVRPLGDHSRRVRLGCRGAETAPESPVSSRSRETRP